MTQDEGGGTVDPASNPTTENEDDKSTSSSGAGAADITAAGNIEAMLRLTALADQLLQSGDLGIYESTTEKLKHDSDRNRRPTAAEASTTTKTTDPKSLDVEDGGGDDDDDALDMFADEIDADKLGGKPSSNGVGGTTVADDDDDAAVAPATEGLAQDFSHEVHWWYRWEKSHAAEEHGPFPSTQMKTWTDLGYFPTGVWLRKDEQEVKDDLGNLYNSERIDFELFT